MKIPRYQILKHKVLQMVGVVLLSVVIGACSTDNTQIVSVDGQLEWRQTDTLDGELIVQVGLEANETENRVVNLQIVQIGTALPLDETVTFKVDDLKSNAIVGEHVIFPRGTEVTIPAGDTVSEDIPVEILSDAVWGNKDLTLALYIAGQGNILPSEIQERRELTIRISKTLESLPVTFLKLRRPGSVSTGLTLVDTDDLIPYTRDEANNEEHIQHSIDFGFWNSTSRDYVFITPTDSNRLSGWGSGRKIRDEWAEENKNDGIFIKLPGGEANEALFTGSQTRDELLDAFNEAESRVVALDTDDYGPGRHIHYIETGDIIFFKSLSRNIYAVIRVDKVTSGNSGYMDLSVKRIVRTH